MSKQVSIARLREFGISPNRELGQNFLIDDNVLRVIGSVAPLQAEDVVLEVGPGLGVLTRWLAERARLVHAVEIDRRLQPALESTLTGIGNVRLQFADVMRIDLGALEPRPQVMVANLPYAVATPVVMNALPVCERFCVMVQREIADRLFAAPGTKAYGAVSVLVQLSCRRLALRPVSRNVFTPVPRVDSALVAFERTSAIAESDEWPRLSALVHGAFAHRRKRLANSLQLAGMPPPPEALAGLRAEQLAPEQFLELGMILTAPAKINLCLRVGPLRPDGFHRLATVFAAIDLRDRLELEPAATTSVEGFPDTLVTGALAALGETRRVRIDKRIPVAAGLGGGSSDAAAVLRGLRGRRPVNELYEIARTLGSDVPFFLSGLEVALGTGRGDVLQPLPDFPRSYGVLLVPSPRELSTADVYAAAEPNEIYEAVRGDLIRAAHTARSAADVAALVANDLESAAISLCPEIAGTLEAVRGAGALAAAVSGSGPTVFGIFPDAAAAEAAQSLVSGSIATVPV